VTEARSALTYATVDSHGFSPHADTLTPMPGVHMRHNGNGHTYVITGFAWLGENDLWGFLHRDVSYDSPMLCRPMSHIYGYRADGSQRYVILNVDAHAHNQPIPDPITLARETLRVKRDAHPDGFSNSDLAGAIEDMLKLSREGFYKIPGAVSLLLREARRRLEKLT
jgi:hypothetical protein